MHRHTHASDTLALCAATTHVSAIPAWHGLQGRYHMQIALTNETRGVIVLLGALKELSRGHPSSIFQPEGLCDARNKTNSSKRNNGSTDARAVVHAL